MNSEKQANRPEFPPIVKIRGAYFVSREALEKFKRAASGGATGDDTPVERNQFVRIAQAASEIGVHPRTLMRLGAAQSASA